MGAAAQADAAVLLWLNSWVGAFPWLDGLVRLVVGDYLIPVLLSLLLLGMWFGARDPRLRECSQKAVFAAFIGIGFANLAVLMINQHLFRLRPFYDHPLTLLFYAPTDSSFPANPAAVGFVLALGVWLGHRRLGLAAFLLAGAWALSRVYAGVSYPSDALAGAALGMTLTALAALLLRLLEPIPTLVLRLAQRLYLA